MRPAHLLLVSGLLVSLSAAAPSSAQTNQFTLHCPTGVTFKAPMPPASGGWSGNNVSWNLTLDPKPGWGLQVVPQPSIAGVTAVCHYQAKNFDGVVINGFGYSQSVAKGTCTANPSIGGFNCSHK